MASAGVKCIPKQDNFETTKNVYLTSNELQTADVQHLTKCEANGVFVNERIEGNYSRQDEEGHCSWRKVVNKEKR